jgi:hypothetical protein
MRLFGSADTRIVGLSAADSYCWFSPGVARPARQY